MQASRDGMECKCIDQNVDSHPASVSLLHNQCKCVGACHAHVHGHPGAQALTCGVYEQAHIISFAQLCQGNALASAVLEYFVVYVRKIVV